MCGIAGAFAVDPHRQVDVERVQQMTDMVRHRGPDGAGIWTADDRSVSFGHRRLSVIDLATGQQPMSDAASGVVVVFNGEIYNYRELRDILRAEGECFRTESDTEVLLRLYLRRGAGFVRELRGMFAFVLWDPRSRELLLARDRVGKKPLYYTLHDGVLYFSSSFRAVQHGAGLQRQVDLLPLFDYLALGYVPAPRTIHPAVSKLQAGTLVRVSGESVQVSSFWDLWQVEPFEGTWDEAVDRLDELINASVSIRLRSDVPLGVFLSGGIDSSLVAAVASRLSQTPVLTFSIGFAEAAFDESAFAATIASRIGSEHRAFRTRFDSLSLVPQLVRHYGEPFGDSSAIPTWLLSHETRQHVTVALGGDGGDEGFGGYDWYRTAMHLSTLARRVPAAFNRLAAGWFSSDRPAFGRRGRWLRAATLLASDEAVRFAALRSFLDPVLTEQICAGELLRTGKSVWMNGSHPVRAAYDRAEGTALRRMRAADIETYLVDCLMPKVDVASMAHALEVRAPLLDQEVVTFGLSLPDSWISDQRTGKTILRAVLDRYLPRDLFERPKQGFSLPLSTWFMKDLRGLIERLPSSEPLLDTGWFNPDGLRRTVDEHFASGRDHSQRIYSLVFFEEWLRQQ